MRVIKWVLAISTFAVLHEQLLSMKGISSARPEQQKEFDRLRSQYNEQLQIAAKEGKNLNTLIGEKQRQLQSVRSNSRKNILISEINDLQKMRSLSFNLEQPALPITKYSKIETGEKIGLPKTFEKQELVITKPGKALSSETLSYSRLATISMNYDEGMKKFDEDIISLVRKPGTFSKPLSQLSSLEVINALINQKVKEYEDLSKRYEELSLYVTAYPSETSRFKRLRNEIIELNDLREANRALYAQKSLPEEFIPNYDKKLKNFLRSIQFASEAGVSGINIEKGGFGTIVRPVVQPLPVQSIEVQPFKTESFAE